MQYIQSFLAQVLKPQHDYQTLLFQIICVFVLVRLYEAVFVKFFRRQAYKSIENDRPFMGYEGSAMQKKELREEKAKKDQASRKQKEETRKQQELEEQKINEENEKQKKQRAQGGSLKELMKKAKNSKQLTTSLQQQIVHSCYQSAIKGFSGAITDFSFNQSYVAASSTDKTIKLFPIDQFFNKQAETSFMFYKLETNYATALVLSQKEDKIYFATQNTINVLTFNPNAEDHHYLKIEKKFNAKCHKENITNMFINANNTFLITTGDDTYVKIWSLKGDLLKEVNTAYGTHFHSAWNQEKNFLVISSGSCDTSIFEVKVNKDLGDKDKTSLAHSFKSIEKVILLRGDKGRAIDVQIDQNATRALLVSNELVKIFKIDVEYLKREEARLLKSFSLTDLEISGSKMTAGASFNYRGKLIYAVAVDQHVLFYNQDFKLIDKIEYAGGQESIKSIVIKDFKKSNQHYVLCFILGQDEQRINIYNLSKWVE